MRLWWQHEPPSAVLLRDARRMRSELVVLDLHVERAVVNAKKQTWILTGEWIGLPPGTASDTTRAATTASVASSLATGQVRVEMGYLYGNGASAVADEGGVLV